MARVAEGEGKLKELGDKLKAEAEAIQKENNLTPEEAGPWIAAMTVIVARMVGFPTSSVARTAVSKSGRPWTSAPINGFTTAPAAWLATTPLPAELVETAGFEAIVPACVTSVTARQLTAHPRARDLGLRAYAGIDDATHRGTDVSAKVLVRLFSLPGADGAPLVVKVCGLRLLLPERLDGNLEEREREPVLLRDLHN